MNRRGVHNAPMRPGAAEVSKNPATTTHLGERWQWSLSSLPTHCSNCVGPQEMACFPRRKSQGDRVCFG